MRLNVGIDVSKDKLDVSIIRGSSVTSLQILNNVESIKGFFTYLIDSYKSDTFYFGYEATNNYMINLRKLLTDYSYNQIMVNPYLMSHYLKSLDLRDKTDLKDSFGIAKFVKSLDESAFLTVHSSSDNLLKKYSTTALLLTKIQTQLKNLKKSQCDIDSPDLDLIISELIVHIKKIKLSLESQSLVILKKVYPQCVQIKNEIKGVGYSLLLQLLPLISNSHQFTVKQFQSYIGLSPRYFSSGSSVHHREVMSKKGNSTVRKLLYLSAMSALRFNPIIKEKYQRLVDNGKTKIVALVACMCHLFRAIFIKFNRYECTCR